jgi:hypothetical protein
MVLISATSPKILGLEGRKNTKRHFLFLADCAFLFLLQRESRNQLRKVSKIKKTEMFAKTSKVLGMVSGAFEKSISPFTIPSSPSREYSMNS